MRHIFPFLSGTVVLKVEGIKPETLINRLRLRFPLRSLVKTSENGLHFEIAYRDKQPVLACIRAMCPTSAITVEKESGLPVLARRMKKRAGLYVGGVLALILAFASSKRIWLISIEGNQRVESAQIRRQLQSLGIAEGQPKKTDDLEYLYNSFLLNEKRISWIAINYDGMIAHVDVKEAEKPEKQIDKSKITNLVASTDGVVRRVDALDGSAAVLPGDTVRKGELLVSAFMETRETGTVLRTARGFVWASTVHSYEISVPKTTAVKQYTGKVKKARTLCILGKKLPLYLPLANAAERYTKTYTVKPFTLFGSIRLPFSIQTERSAAYVEREKTVTKETAAEKAAAEMAKRIENDFERAEILKRTETFSETDTAYVFTFEFLCLENIAVPVELQFEE